MSFLITTIVAGELYLNFAPVYIYSLKKSYPDYDIKIYSWDKIPKNIKEILKDINCEDCLIEIDLPIAKTPNNIKASRFLYTHDLKYNYIFVGDIDFFICPEIPSLLDHHLDFCNTHNLSYSNRVRSGTKRLTGLHFYKTADYNVDVLKSFKNNFENIQSHCGDEELLYQIINKMGFEFPKKIIGERLQHGIHIKRRYGKDLSAKEKEYSNIFKNAYNNDNVFKNILNRLSKQARSYINDCYRRLS